MNITLLLKQLISIPSYYDGVINESKYENFIRQFIKTHTQLKVATQIVN